MARGGGEHGVGITGGCELLGERQRHRPDHGGENRVGVLPKRRNIRSEVLGADRRPDFLEDLPAAGLEGALETADDLVTEGIVGADRGDLLVALVAGPLPKRMAWLRTGPAGADEIGVFG